MHWNPKRRIAWDANMGCQQSDSRPLQCAIWNFFLDFIFVSLFRYSTFFFFLAWISPPNSTLGIFEWWFYLGNINCSGSVCPHWFCLTLERMSIVWCFILLENSGIFLNQVSFLSIAFTGLFCLWGCVCLGCIWMWREEFITQTILST